MASKTSDADYIDIEVDDFNGVGNCGTQLHSYFRLGAADSTVTHGDDLTGQITDFVDDTRIRGGKDGCPAVTADDKNTFHTLTQAQRQAETDLLLTKGGARDHTDGNRISTTRGDKVEVVYGNYKLLVLGREQWNQDGENNDFGVGLHWESSGGITYHYDEVPGQIIDVRWEYGTETNTWRVIEECDKGHVVSRYHGLDKDWIQGGDVVTRIGSLGAYKVKHEGATWSSVKDEHGFITDTHFDKPSDSAHATGVAWPSDSQLPNVTEHVFADKVSEWTVTKNIVEKIGQKSRYVHLFDDSQYAGELVERHTYTELFQSHNYGDDSLEIWMGPFYFESFSGAQFSNKSHVFIDFRVGFMITEINLVSVLEANMAVLMANVEVAHKGKIDFVLAPRALEVSACLVGLEDKDTHIDVHGLRSSTSASVNAN